MGRFQDDPGCNTCLQGLRPTLDAQTPAIARFQARKLMFGYRSHQIISRRDTESEKIVSHLGADRMNAVVRSASITKTVTVETG